MWFAKSLLRPRGPRFSWLVLLISKYILNLDLNQNLVCNTSKFLTEHEQDLPRFPLVFQAFETKNQKYIMYDACVVQYFRAQWVRPWQENVLRSMKGTLVEIPRHLQGPVVQRLNSVMIF